MILLDVNLLIYAVDADSPHHAKARRWLEEALSSGTAIGFAWVVILAFLRITTRPEVFLKPLSPDDALDYVDEWLGLPSVSPVRPGEGHWAILRGLLKASGTAGNLTSDAHLAALALEGGWTVYSTDHDFRRFPGVEVVNPLA